MNNIRIIAVGSVKEDFYRAKISFFMNEINKYKKAMIVEPGDESIPQGASEAAIKEIKEKEGQKILEHVKPNDYVIALCIEGIATDAEKLKNIVGKAFAKGDGDIVFIIGGSLGLSNAVIKRADYKMSFSKMTFPHRLMRVMLLEQIAKLGGG